MAAADVRFTPKSGHSPFARPERSLSFSAFSLQLLAKRIPVDFPGMPGRKLRDEVIDVWPFKPFNSIGDPIPQISLINTCIGARHDKCVEEFRSSVRQQRQDAQAKYDQAREARPLCRRA